MDFDSANFGWPPGQFHKDKGINGYEQTCWHFCFWFGGRGRGCKVMRLLVPRVDICRVTDSNPSKFVPSHHYCKDPNISTQSRAPLIRLQGVLEYHWFLLLEGCGTLWRKRTGLGLQFRVVDDKVNTKLQVGHTEVVSRLTGHLFNAFLHYHFTA